MHWIALRATGSRMFVNQPKRKYFCKHGNWFHADEEISRRRKSSRSTLKDNSMKIAGNNSFESNKWNQL